MAAIQYCICNLYRLYTKKKKTTKIYINSRTLKDCDKMFLFMLPYSEKKTKNEKSYRIMDKKKTIDVMISLSHISCSHCFGTTIP